MAHRSTRRLSTALLVAGLIACSDPQAEKVAAFERGGRYFDEGKFAEAIVEYQNAIKVDERYGEARLKLAQSYLRLGEVEGALAQAVRAADLLPNDVSAQLEAANLLLATGNFQDARARAQKALETDARNVDAQLVIANALAGLKDFDGAIKQAQQAINLDPGQSASYASLAALQASRGEMELARQAFEQAVVADPKSIRAWLAQANFQFQTGDRAGAELSLKRAIGIDPRDATANRALAVFYTLTNRRAEAEPHLKTLIEVAPTAESQLSLADFYVDERRFDEARAVLEPMTKGGPDDTQARLRLANIEYLNRQVANAHGILDELLKAQPGNVDVVVMKARWLLQEKKSAEALKLATAAVGANPQSVEAHYALGLIQMETRDVDGALTSFNEVLRLNPGVAAAQVQLSRLELSKGDAATAVEFAESALKAAPTDRDVRLLLARGLLARGDVAGARREFAPLQREYPNAAVVYAFDGLIRAADNDQPGARSAFERALRVNPDHIVALGGLANLLASQGKTGEARALVDRRVTGATGQPRPELLLLSARAHAQDGDLAGAERTLRQVIASDANNAEAYGVLGQIFLQQRRLDEARREFETLAQRNPRDTSSRIMVASIFEMQQKPAEAKRLYAEVLSIDPKAAVAANNLAWINAEEGANLDEALSLAQSAVELQPDRPEIHDTLGWVYYKKNMLPLAQRSFERSIELDAGNPDYHYRLALVYSKAGDKFRARRSARAALEINPKMTQASELIASLDR